MSACCDVQQSASSGSSLNLSESESNWLLIMAESMHLWYITLGIPDLASPHLSSYCLAVKPPLPYGLGGLQLVPAVSIQKILQYNLGIPDTQCKMCETEALCGQSLWKQESRRRKFPGLTCHLHLFFFLCQCLTELSSLHSKVASGLHKPSQDLGN